MGKTRQLNEMRDDLTQVIQRYHYISLSQQSSKVGRCAVRVSRRLGQLARSAQTMHTEPVTILVEVLVAWARTEEAVAGADKIKPDNPRWVVMEAIESCRLALLNLLIGWGHKYADMRILLPIEVKMILYEEMDALEWQRMDDAATGPLIDIDIEEDE